MLFLSLIDVFIPIRCIQTTLVVVKTKKKNVFGDTQRKCRWFYAYEILILRMGASTVFHSCIYIFAQSASEFATTNNGST